jgi:hypothetical protein
MGKFGRVRPCMGRIADLFPQRLYGFLDTKESTGVLSSLGDVSKMLMCYPL